MKLPALAFGAIWSIFFFVNFWIGHKEETRWFFLLALIHLVWSRIEILIEQNKK